jgi:hypothetical protein
MVIKCSLYSFVIMCTLIENKLVFRIKPFLDLNYELSVILRLAILETNS